MAEKKLTIKQTKFVKEYVKNDGNGTKAALAVYDTTDADTARAISSENLAKPAIRDAVDAALNKHGITMDDAVAPIAKALKAKKVFYVDGVKIVSGDDDLEMQLKGSDRALKLMGAGNKEDAGGNTINFINSATFNSKKYIK